MSDHWEQFPCIIDDQPAFISYDHGIGEHLDQLPFANFAVFKAPLDAPNDDGLPCGDEFARLNALEDFLCAQFSQDEGVQTGRLTVGGHRYYHFYTLLDEAACRAIAARAGAASGYAVGLYVEADPAYGHYWNELYPTPEDWQVIQDIRVQEALRAEGDTLEQPRPIEHWTYFKTMQGRAAFVEAVAHLAQCVDQYEAPQAPDEPFAARLRHTGLPDHRSINSVTVGLVRAASEHGGRYDGWETMVCKNPAD